MELDKLHVAHLDAGPVRHGDAVAGGDVGIGCVKVRLARAAGGQHHHRRLKGEDVAVAHIEGVNPQYAVVTLGGFGREFAARNDVDGEHVLVHRDARLQRKRLDQRGLDGLAGHVLDVQHAALGVAALAAEVVAAVRIPRKFQTELDQLLHAGRAVAHDLAHNLFVAQAVAGHQGVLHVLVDVIGFGRDHRDAALGIVGVGFGLVFLGQDSHRTAEPCGLQREAQAGDAAADHQDVKRRSGAHRISLSIKRTSSTQTAIVITLLPRVISPLIASIVSRSTMDT